MERVQQSHLLPPVPCRTFTGKHHRVHPVLVPDVRPGKIPIALLKSKEIAVGFPRSFQQTDLLAYVFEAGQHPAQLHTVGRCHRRGHVGRDNGGHRHRVFRHCSFFDPGAAEVVKKKDAHFVPVNEPVSTAAIRDCRSHPVAVRIGAQQQVRLHPLTEGKPPFHGLPDLRIWIGAGREIPVGQFLLRNDGHVPDPHFGQQLFDRLQPGAVQRSIDQFQVGNVVAGAQSQHRVHKGIQAGVRDILDVPRL